MSIVAYEGNILYKGQLIEGELGVDEDGIIIGIKKRFEGAKHVNFSGRVIIPGAIDIHVHFRDPGYTHKEDFETGSTAALAGGVTTVFDMPNTNPRVKNAKTFNKKLRIASKKSTVDFGLYGGVWEDSKLEDLLKLTKALKIYLYEWKNLEKLKEISQKIPENIFISAHTEHPHYLHEGEFCSLDEYNILRPPQAELEGIKLVLELFEKKKIHIAHVTTEEGLNYLLKKPYTFEVTPHHLLLNKDMDLWPYGVVNPPLRSRRDNEALWRAFFRASVPVYASDHAPHDLSEKESDNPLPGIPGVQEALPLMLVLVKDEILRLEDLMTMYSYIPSKLTGIDQYKGTLEPGKYADFLVIDFSEEKRIKEKMLFYKCGWTIYRGLRAIFPQHVYVRGEALVDNWEVNEQPGYGEYVYSRDFRKYMF